MGYLLEYSNNYSKTSGSLWQYYRDKQTLTLCSYYVTYEFQSESTLYSCLNAKERPARRWQ